MEVGLVRVYREIIVLKVFRGASTYHSVHRYHTTIIILHTKYYHTTTVPYYHTHLELSNVPHKRHHCTVRPPSPIHQQRIFGHIRGHSSDHVLDKEGQQGSFGRIFGRIYRILVAFLVPFTGSEYENWSSLLVHSAYIEARVYVCEGGARQGVQVGPLLGAFVLHHGLRSSSSRSSSSSSNS
jgi:hypothetical protein